jgi:Helix-hairpin-helix motif
LEDLVNPPTIIPSGSTRTRRSLGTIIWALIPLLSFGMLAPVPFAYAAVRLRQRRMWMVTAVYVIAWLACALATSAPDGSLGDRLQGTMALALMGAGTAHAFLLRGRVFAPPPIQPALVAALTARQRRGEARAIASRDTALARELRIGRPDLPRQFDDGGLVDVNHVPAQVLIDRLALSPAQAAQVVEARDRLGGFAGTEELIAFTELSPEAVDGLQEHLVFLAVK